MHTGDYDDDNDDDDKSSTLTLTLSPTHILNRYRFASLAQALLVEMW